MNPLADQQQPQQPQGTAQGNPQGANPLAALAGPMPGLPPPPPSPSAAQTTAAVRRLSAVQEAMRQVMATDGFGRENVRPVILDQASRLMASKLLSISEVMNAIGKVSADPLAQKAQVEQIFSAARQAENAVLAHHTAAVAMGMVPRSGGEKYRSEDHARHMSDLLNNHYPTRA